MLYENKERKENMIENVDFFSISLKLTEVNIPNYKVNLEYNYMFSKGEELKNSYCFKNNVMFIEINSVLDFEMLSKIIEIISDIIKITDNRKNKEIEINVINEKKKECFIYLTDNSYFTREDASIKKTSNISVNYEGNKVMDVYIPKKLKRMPKILQMFISKKPFLINPESYLNEVKQTLLTYFKNETWNSKIIESIKFSLYIKGGNVEIDNKTIEYFIDYFIGLNKRLKTDVCEILFMIEYGNCHISLKNSPELISDIIDYVESYCNNLTRLPDIHLSNSFRLNNKVYELNIFNLQNNRFKIIIWDVQKYETVLCFIFESSNDFFNKTNFIKKILKNKDFIIDISNRYKLVFPEYLTQLFNKLLPRFGIFYK
jgi:hypothetical protein